MLVWFKGVDGRIAVNANSVTCVHEDYSNDSLTRIWFAGEDGVRVVEPVDDVVLKLNAGGA